MRMAMIRIMLTVRPMLLSILIWVMDMAAGVAVGTIPGITIRGIDLTGHIRIGLVLIGTGAGVVGMAAGTIHGMIHGTMEGIMDITVGTMADITVGITVDTIRIIIPAIMVITDPTIQEIRVDGRQQQHTDKEAVAVRDILPHLPLTVAVRQ